MLRVVYLGFSFISHCIDKIVFLWKAILSPVIISILIGSFFFFSPPQAGVQAKTVSMEQPPHFQQLEEYSARVEKHKEEQDRAKREEALNKALVKHVVQPGETLTQIARAYRTDLESLVCWNGINDPNLIFPGQVLDLLAIQGTIHLVREGDTLQSIAECYQSSPQLVASFNLLAEPLILVPGNKMVIPGGILPLAEKKAVQASLLASRYGERSSLPPGPSFDWPIKGWISSPFGWRKGEFHYGLDIAVAHGSTIRAAAAGVVLETGIKQGYGLMLVLKHSGEWKTLYAHCSRLLVEKNEKVARGQPIALIGSTGNSTGPHLHLEMIYDQQRFNPLLLLPGNGD